MFDSRKIEELLQDDASIHDFVVLLRGSTSSRPRFVAYVVTRGVQSVARITSRLGAALPESQMPYAVVLVSNIPLTPSGCVDEASLCQLPIFDDRLVQRWRDVALEIPGVEDAVAVVGPRASRSAIYHINDLLPGAIAHRHMASTAESDQLAPTPVEAPATISTKSSLLLGATIRRSAADPTTLSGALIRAAQQSPDLGSEYVQADGTLVTQSYPELLEVSKRVATGLFELGLRPGDRVLFQLERNQDFIEAFWACAFGGYVPVPISIASQYELGDAIVQKLHNAWSMFDGPMVLSDTKLVPGLRRLADQAELRNFRVEPIEELRRCAAVVHDHSPSPDDTAILLLTSGSTGLPKAVVQSHRALLSRSLATAQFNGFTTDDVSFNWMPLDHVGGIVMFHLRDVVACCRQVHAPTGTILEDPLKWLEWIDRVGATITWAPNFAFGLVNEHAAEIAGGSWDLSRMRFILNGGESVVAKTARRFLQLLAPHGLPPSAMHPAWGMSETSSGVAYSDSFSIDNTHDNDRSVEVGAPVPGVSLRIVGPDNNVLPEGQIGSLQIMGACVTSGYFKNPDLNDEVFTEDGWFVTGDLGFIRDGGLTITGRDKDEIIINGVNYTASDIESVVDSIKGVQVSFSAACAVRPSGANTDSLAVFFSPSNGAANHLGELLPSIRGVVATAVGVTPTFVIPVESTEIPKTAIGKIQRSQLKERFESGQFADSVKESDILLENTNTLPDWFCRRSWQPKQPRNRRPQCDGATLVFVDPGGVSEQVAADLAKTRTVVSVERGERFEQVSRCSYRMDPAAQDDYAKLLASVVEDGLQVEQVVHCWTMTSDGDVFDDCEALDRAQTLGVYSMLFVIQALAKTNVAEANVELLACSTDLQPLPGAPVIHFEHAPILGLMKCAFQELPWLTGRHIDLADDAGADSVSFILDELDVIEVEREVAYRDGQRLVKRIEKLEITNTTVGELPFRRGGMYLLSGGLGGIGVEVAKMLLTMFEARLVLIGQSPIASEGTTADSQKSQTLRLLQSLPGEVIYEAADVSDAVQVEAVVDRATSNWGCDLDGILHLAGVMREELVMDTTRRRFSDAMQAKAMGAMVLHNVLRARGGGVMISFSSLASTFGWATMAGYSAANAFLDHFAAAQGGRDGVQHYCYGWSIWDGIGMSLDSQMTDPVESRGYAAMSSRQALNSLLVALTRDQREALIGLESSHPNVHRYTDLLPFGLNELTCFCQSKAAENILGSSESWQLLDEFGVSSTSHFHIVDELPRTPGGEIDLAGEHLQVGAVRGKSDSYVPPRTAMERRLALILRELVGMPRIGVHESFFDLGLDSLMATRFLNRVREITDVPLTLKHLFETPTLEGVANRLQAASAGTTEPTAVRESGVDAELRDIINNLSDEEIDGILVDLLPEEA